MSFSTSSSGRPTFIPKDAQYYFHRVKEGETTEGIASKFNLSAEVALREIGLAQPKVGDVLVIDLKAGTIAPSIS